MKSVDGSWWWRLHCVDQWRGGGGRVGTISEMVFPTQALISTPYILANQLHYGRWKLSVYIWWPGELSGFTPSASPSLPFQQRQRSSITAHSPWRRSSSCDSSCALWRHCSIELISPCRVCTQPTPFAHGEMLKKAYGWINDAHSRPPPHPRAQKDGTGSERLFKNAFFPSASAPLRSALRKHSSIAIK